MQNLLRGTQMDLIQKPLAKGGTDVFSGLVDMQNFSEVTLVGILSSVGSTDIVNLKGYWSTTSTANSTSKGLTVISTANFQLSSTKGEEDGLLRMSLVHPRKRYVGCKLTRSATVEYAGTLAIRSGPVRFISSTKSSTDDLATPILYQPQTTGSTST